MTLVSVAGALVAALVLPMQQVAQVLNVAVANGILHSLDLKGAATSGGILDLLNLVEVRARIASRKLRSRGTGILLLGI
jgi:hypothetical protein